MLDKAEQVRLDVTIKTSRSHKANFGQFMTPSTVARFMASLFPSSSLPSCHLLDSGAGVGALSCAFLDRWEAGGFGFRSVEVIVYEIDPAMRAHLVETLDVYARRSARPLKATAQHYSLRRTLSVPRYLVDSAPIL